MSLLVPLHGEMESERPLTPREHERVVSARVHEVFDGRRRALFDAERLSEEESGERSLEPGSWKCRVVEQPTTPKRIGCEQNPQ